MRFLFIGDVVGPPGLAALKTFVPRLRASERLDFVVANAENATNGSGLSPRDYRAIRAAGVDAITLGDHIYKKFEIADVMKHAEEPLCKPANFPKSSPGNDCVRLEIGGKRIVVFCLLGRTYMRAVDCPFEAADRILDQWKSTTDLFVVDIHAEATADKYQLLHYLKGRVSAILGTHTHVPTADEQILDGTAYISDVGMTGPYESILGRRIDRVLTAAVSFVPSAFDVATNDVRLAGAIVEWDAGTGKAVEIKRVMVKES